jgi:hypothetical protein
VLIILLSATLNQGVEFQCGVPPEEPLVEVAIQLLTVNLNHRVYCINKYLKCPSSQCVVPPES